MTHGYLRYLIKLNLERTNVRDQGLIEALSGPIGFGEQISMYSKCIYSKEEERRDEKMKITRKREEKKKKEE